VDDPRHPGDGPAAGSVPVRLGVLSEREAEQADIKGRLQTLTAALDGATAQIRAITPARR
jgi:hypothetical protein